MLILNDFLLGIDEKGPQLFHMDPSGTFVQYDAKAIGSGSEGAQQSLKVNNKYISFLTYLQYFYDSMS